MDRPYRRIDTTADVGLAATGSSLEEIFSNLAKGLFSLMSTLTLIRKRISRRIDLRAESLEDLLVAWLNELIFIREAEGILFRDFTIRFMDEKGLEAICSGEPIDNMRHVLKMEVKAATYHRLSLWQDPESRWHAQVILDV